MVQLVQTGSGSLGLKSNEWPNYRERHAEERSREIRARTRPACSWLQNLILWLVCLVFVSWNETFAEVQLWQSFGLEQKRRWWHPISDFLARLFSDSTRPFLFFAQRTLEENEHLTLLLCTLVLRTPPECTSGASSEIFVSRWQTSPARLLMNVRPVGDWHLPDDPSACFRWQLGK